jgi:hypothetical protein
MSVLGHWIHWFIRRPVRWLVSYLVSQADCLFDSFFISFLPFCFPFLLDKWIALMMFYLRLPKLTSQRFQSSTCDAVSTGKWLPMRSSKAKEGQVRTT